MKLHPPAQQSLLLDPPYQIRLSALAIKNGDVVNNERHNFNGPLCNRGINQDREPSRYEFSDNMSDVERREGILP